MPGSKWALALTDVSDPRSLSYRFRSARIAPFLEMVREVHARKGRVRVLDVGGTAVYWRILPDGFLDEHETIITVVNLPGESLPADDGRFRYLHGDGCDLSMFEDDAFDIVHSNSVIEHVGDWNRMIRFASEVSRLAPAYFVQTPDFWFPVEPHAVALGFHWLPKALRVLLVQRFAFGHFRRVHSREDAVALVDSAQLLTARRMRRLFGDAVILHERVFGLPKSLVAVRQKRACEEGAASGG